MLPNAVVDSYRDLQVWQRAMELAEATYHLTRVFPKDEQFALTSQVRRAASSIPANIAEGYGRATRPAYLNHLRIAQGSLKELETHLILVQRVGLCEAKAAESALALADEVGRMLRALLIKLKPAT